MLAFDALQRLLASIDSLSDHVSALWTFLIYGFKLGDEFALRIISTSKKHAQPRAPLRDFSPALWTFDFKID